MGSKKFQAKTTQEKFDVVVRDRMVGLFKDEPFFKGIRVNSKGITAFIDAPGKKTSAYRSFLNFVGRHNVKLADHITRRRL